MRKCNSLSQRHADIAVQGMAKRLQSSQQSLDTAQDSYNCKCPGIRGAVLLGLGEAWWQTQSHIA